MGKSIGRPFQLSKSVIIQLLGDEQFYKKCVAYIFMRDQGLAAVEQYNRAVANKEDGCEGCPQKHKDENGYVAGPIAAFVRVTQDLHEVGPDQLQPLRTFIVGKLGYQPVTILLYHKVNGAPQTLKF